MPATKKKSGTKSATKSAPKKKAAPAKKTAKKAPVKKKTTAASASSEAKKPRSKTGNDISFTNFEPYQAKRGEEYMNEGQIAHFRNILQSWKRELMEEVDRTLQHLQDEAANYPDPNDRATQESDFTMELRTRDRERKLIKKIDESIQMLESGEYGFCESCGIEIGIRRLEARPTATLCIDCKTLDEIREKQMSK